jgi:hypothetical protein
VIWPFAISDLRFLIFDLCPHQNSPIIRLLTDKSSAADRQSSISNGKSPIRNHHWPITNPSSIANRKSSIRHSLVTNVSPAARIRPRTELAEERLEKLVMKLIEAVIRHLQIVELRPLAEATDGQVKNRQPRHPLLRGVAHVVRLNFTEEPQHPHHNPFCPLLGEAQANHPRPLLS